MQYELEESSDFLFAKALNKRFTEEEIHEGLKLLVNENLEKADVEKLELFLMDINEEADWILMLTEISKIYSIEMEVIITNLKKIGLFKKIKDEYQRPKYSGFLKLFL